MATTTKATDTAAATTPKPVAPRRRARSTSDAAATLAALREDIREEVRQEEFATIAANWETLTSILQAHEEKLGMIHEAVGGVRVEQQSLPGAVVSALEERFGTEMLALDGSEPETPTAVDPAVLAELTIGSQAADESDLEEGVVVGDAFLDFIESHMLLSKSWIDRRPILQGVRADYNPKGMMQLKILRAGSYETGYHMRNTILTTVMDTEDSPYVVGEYMDGVRIIPMSPEQVDRVCDAINAAVHLATPDAPGA